MSVEPRPPAVAKRRPWYQRRKLVLTLVSAFGTVLLTWVAGGQAPATVVCRPAAVPSQVVSVR